MGKIPPNEMLNKTYRSPFVYGGDKDFNRDREKLFNSYFSNMLVRVLGMFEYKGLPETLDQTTMEKYLLRFGYCIITQVPKNIRNEGGLFVLSGGLGGEIDDDFNPTEANVASPWMRFTKSGMRVGEECVVIKNDPFYIGLSPLFSRYCSQLADAELTLRLQLVNMRTNVLYHANDDSAKEDAEAYLRNIQEGKLGIIGGDSFFEGIDFDTKDASPKVGASIKDTLEAMQFLNAHSFIELGLNDNYNMKREAINSTETDANADTLLPLVERMLEERRKGVEVLNRVYGLDVSVDFAGAWKRVMEDTELNQEAKEKAVEGMDDPKPEEPTNPEEPPKEGEE